MMGTYHMTIKREVNMQHIYLCECGFETVYNTDMKAPRNVKCGKRGCKKSIPRDDLKKSKGGDNEGT